jgi:virulence activator alpha
VAGARRRAWRPRELTGRRRRRYQLTERGRQAFRRWLADPHTAGYELRDPGLLKLALGADPADLAAGQLEIHRRKLEAYEQIAAAIDVEGQSGRLLTLHAGIGHEREYVRFWSRLAADAPQRGVRARSRRGPGGDAGGGR